MTVGEVSLNQYGILLRPHANVRYEESAKKLAHLEFHFIAQRLGHAWQAEEKEIASIPLLAFEAETVTERDYQALSRLSNMMALFQIMDGELLRPLTFMSNGMFSDMASILKYRGKTNEVFTRFLINAALFHADVAFDDAVWLLDPMCGKGTTLFCAWRDEINAIGIELDKKEIDESIAFTKSYLKRGRVKFSYEQSSRTLPKGAARVCSFTLKSPALSSGESAFDGLVLREICGNASFVQPMLGRQKVDLIVADLPYGVVHSNGQSKRGKDTLYFVQKQLKDWLAVLNKGGTMALSFNAYTMKRDELRTICEEAGFHVFCGEEYDQMEHWVEQAVMRDVVIAKKN